VVSDPNGRIIVGVVVLVGPPSVSDPSDDYPFILSNSNLSDCHQIDRDTRFGVSPLLAR
jgi:hypothetical protein